MNITRLTAEQLRHAADIVEKIGSLEAQLLKYVGGGSSSSPAVAPRKKSKMSAAGRARIIAAQKARWAKVKAGKKGVKPAKAKKRTMSAAARARIAAVARARWARVKAAGKKAL
jgi:hypothetical protein